MLIQKAGTIGNALKIAQTDHNWQQKKKQDEKKAKQEMDPETRQILQYQEDLKQMRESNQMSSIASKLKSGSELAPEEIEYLKKNSPDSYKEYEEVKAEKEAYERQLKACKSQEDVEKLKLSKAGQFMAETKSVVENPNIPKGKKLELLEKIVKKSTSVWETHAQFVKSGQYENLPTDDEIKTAKESLPDARQLPVEEPETEENDAKQPGLNSDGSTTAELTLPELKAKSEAVIAETLEKLKE